MNADGHIAQTEGLENEVLYSPGCCAEAIAITKITAMPMPSAVSVFLETPNEQAAAELNEDEALTRIAAIASDVNIGQAIEAGNAKDIYLPPFQP